MQNGSAPDLGDTSGAPAAESQAAAGPAEGQAAAGPAEGQAAAGPADGLAIPSQPDDQAPERQGDDQAASAGADGEGVPGPRASLEAILLVADEPVSEVVIAQVLERPRAEGAGTLRELAASYAGGEGGFGLREVAGGWRFYTREECAPVVERFVSDGQEVRLTQAALETLAVVAYRQPRSRARVSAVRGVNCDGVIRTLVLRGLVEEAGTDPETGAVLC